MTDSNSRKLSAGFVKKRGIVLKLITRYCVGIALAINVTGAFFTSKNILKNSL